jgi:hypothetical protein
MRHNTTNTSIEPRVDFDSEHFTPPGDAILTTVAPPLAVGLHGSTLDTFLLLEVHGVS